MMVRPTTEITALILRTGRDLPAWVESWAVAEGLEVQAVPSPQALAHTVLRSRPRVIILDGRDGASGIHNALAACAQLKRDSFSGIVPIAVLVAVDRFAEAFAAGADEVIREGADSSADACIRLGAMLRRSDRDTDVHPSTRLPSTREIDAELARRVASDDMFAVCYADLDHFKEFNDRYGYFRGNQIIQLLARLLHDVVKGVCGEHGFVGHIGGDDFLYVLPLPELAGVCDEVIQVFDELIPLQYSAHDRRVGYFFGKDRRGELHKVPLMTLSVGVVTNQRRIFAQASDVSELASEMKSYAKTLPGSIWVADRRRDDDARHTNVAECAASPGAAIGATNTPVAQ